MIRATINAVAVYYGVSSDDLLGRRRLKEFSRPRHVAMFLAKKLTGRSWQIIAMAFGRDHTTIIYGARLIDRLRQTDQRLEGDIEEIWQRLLYAELQREKERQTTATKG